MTKIEATDGKNSLLRDGKVAIIGYIHPMSLRTLENGKTYEVFVVEMDFENDGISDFLVFKNKKLFSCMVDLKRPKFIQDLYREISKHKDVGYNAAMNVVVGGYMWEMMMDDHKD